MTFRAVFVGFVGFVGFVIDFGVALRAAIVFVAREGLAAGVALRAADFFASSFPFDATFRAVFFATFAGVLGAASFFTFATGFGATLRAVRVATVVFVAREGRATVAALFGVFFTVFFVAVRAGVTFVGAVGFRGAGVLFATVFTGFPSLLEGEDLGVFFAIFFAAVRVGVTFVGAVGFRGAGVALFLAAVFFATVFTIFLTLLEGEGFAVFFAVFFGAVRTGVTFVGAVGFRGAGVAFFLAAVFFATVFTIFLTLLEGEGFAVFFAVFLTVFFAVFFATVRVGVTFVGAVGFRETGVVFFLVAVFFATVFTSLLTFLEGKGFGVFFAAVRVATVVFVAREGRVTDWSATSAARAAAAASAAA